MRLFFSLALIGFFSTFSAQSVITFPYNPDSDGNAFVATPDMLETLSVFGSVFTPAEIQIDGVGLLQVIQDLQNQINNNALPDGILSGDLLIWNGTAWMPGPPVDDCGVLHGDNSTCTDDCGVPNGDNSTCPFCGDPISHEGYDYSTVQIGDQCWFAENCRYLPVVSPSSEGNTTDPYYYVYGYQGTDVITAQAQATYSTYGVLYNWPAVMEPGICPSNWHIPTDLEWQTMEIALGMSASDASSTGWRGTDQGSQMKSTIGWNSGGNGSNSSGLTALPGGYRDSGGFYYDGVYGNWWSASESGSYSWRRGLGSSNDIVYRSNVSRSEGFSARCVRN